MSDINLSNNEIDTKTSEDKPINQPKDSKEEKKARKEAKKLAKEKAKKDAEEAKEKAKREAIATKEKAKKEAEEAKEKAKREAIVTEERAKKEAVEISITSKSETIKKKETKKTSHKLYKGEVKLLILPPVDFKNLNELENVLRNTKNLKLLLTGGTADGGIQIVVSTSEPIPLLNVLMETPQVEEAIGKDDTIHISLK